MKANVTKQPPPTNSVGGGRVVCGGGGGGCGGFSFLFTLKCDIFLSCLSFVGFSNIINLHKIGRLAIPSIFPTYSSSCRVRFGLNFVGVSRLYCRLGRCVNLAASPSDNKADKQASNKQNRHQKNFHVFM
jgi:hypothetical protein